ncbi:MAG: hypothetical protein J6W52_13310 [Bacteroidaceae bacterium]|nr:hypothetical protein [Bacteroidaceae bacterium]
MKKTYIQPCMEEMQAQVTQILAGSVTGVGGIEYGGIDDDGSLDPEVKEDRWDMWNNE